ncbi:D-2-hydroxyacid dehydrogenase [Fodinicola feengrottensis]
MAAVEAAAEVRYADAAGLPAALRGADCLLVWDFLSRAVEPAFAAADRLGWLHIASTGVDNVLFPAMRQSDVLLTNSSGIFDGAIAEYVLGCVLAFAKDFRTTLTAQREKRWYHRETERIAGRRAVVVGTGPIGRAIARLLAAAGLQVTGVGRTARVADPDFVAVQASSDLHKCLGEADFVVAVAPLTDATAGMFDKAAFGAMKPTARFINVGRGGLVVTDDLVEALQGKVIAGAALDVFEIEPLPVRHPLWSLPNVLISPHMSGDFVGWLPALAELFVDNFGKWQAGMPLRNVVDKQLGYVPAR